MPRLKEERAAYNAKGKDSKDFEFLSLDKERRRRVQALHGFVVTPVVG